MRNTIKMRLFAGIRVVALLALLSSTALWAGDTIAVSGGGYHSLALKSDGTVWAWGANWCGRLGDGTNTDRWTPVQVSGLSGITSIAGGGGHSLALKNDGSVWVWGLNNFGQLGNGTTTDRWTPAQVLGLSGVTAIAAGDAHSLALKNDGSVWAWGYRYQGQVGDGGVTGANTRSTPAQVSGLSGVIAIAGGRSHSLALRNDGTVWAWGWNSSGQLGDGTTAERGTPAQVSGLNGITAIAGGDAHSLALKNDGTVWAWGCNGCGRLGDGTTANCLTPVQVSGLSGVTRIAGGMWHSLALRNDGTVWAWGDNYSGELGDGTTTNRVTPVQVSGLSGVTAIGGGSSHSLALKGDGSIWTWGDNRYGSLGDGTTADRWTPVQVSSGGSAVATPVFSPAEGRYPSAQPVTIWCATSGATIYYTTDGTTPTTASPVYSAPLGVGAPTTLKAFAVKSGMADSAVASATYAIAHGVAFTGFTAVAHGKWHSLALRNDTTVWAWGPNWRGQLGDGTNTDRWAPGPVSGLSGITAIAGGCGDYSLALKNDGTVWGWGYNDCGQLGDSTTADRWTSVQVSGLSGITSIAGGSLYSLALKNDGTVWAWGYNWWGQLGDGTNTDRWAPGQVSGLSGVTAIAGAGDFGLALRNDGTVWAWGGNWAGQNGDGTTISHSTPVQVSGLGGITAIAGGEWHSLALKDDGTVWAWGSNWCGRLGDGTTIDRWAPVQVSGLTGVTAIAGGSEHSLALKNDSTVWAWGRNNCGQLGDGTATDRSMPVQVSGLSGIAAVAAGGAHSLALKNNGTVWTWGLNSAGQLGDGTMTNRLTPVYVVGGGSAITSPLTATGVVGAAFSYQITATNGPTSYNATGLPAGLSIDTGTGAITGTPTAAGTTSVTISATNADGTGTATLTITIASANLYWSGTGTWDNSTVNWGTSPGGPYNVSAWQPGANAVFEGTAGTVTLGADVSVTNITFATDGYTVGGPNTITFTGAANITTGVGSDTIGAIIGDSGGVDLAKSGTGTLVLTAANAYSGSVTVKAGTLQLGDGTNGHDGSIANTSGVTNNAALVYNVFGNQTVNYGIAGAGTFTKSGAGTLTVSGMGIVYIGDTFINAGTLTLIGAGIVYTGSTTVNAGTLVLQDTTSFASPCTVNGGASLNLNKTVNGLANRSKITGTISGAGTLNVNNATSGINGGWVIFDSPGVGLSNFTGTVNVNSGVLSMDWLTGAWSGNPKLNVVSGGIFAIRGQDISVDALTGDGDVMNSWNGHGAVGDTLTIGAGNGSGVFSGIIHGSIATGGTDGTVDQGIPNLVKSGSGTQTFSGASTYAGSTALNAGTLRLQGDIATLATSSITISGGGTLDIDGTGTADPDRIPDTAPITLSGGTLSMSAPPNVARTETVGNVVLNSGSNSIVVVPNGTGTAQLTAAGLTRNGDAILSFTRGMTSPEGNLYAGGIADGMLLRWATANGAPAKYTTADGVVPAFTGNVYTSVKSGNWDDITTWTPVPPAGGPTANDEIIVDASHIIALNGADRAAAYVKFNGSGQIIGAPNTLTIGSAIEVTAAAGSPAITCNVAQTNLAIAQDSPGTLEISGVISGVGGILKEGTGELALTTANTFSGGYGAYYVTVDLNQGVLTLGHANALGTGNLYITGNGTELRTTPAAPLTINSGLYIGGDFTFGTGTSNDLTFSRSGRVNMVGDIMLWSGDRTITVAAGRTLTFGGLGGDTVGRGLTTAGTGTLRFTGSCNFTKFLNVTAGTLSLTNSAMMAMTSSPGISIAGGGTMDIDNSAVTFTRDTVFVEDAVPGGASTGADGGDGWTWVSSNPAPYSGTQAHQSNIAVGAEHQHYFNNANGPPISAGDIIYTYVYLDPANPPAEVMLQFNAAGSWEHRAYWGANNLNWGTDGTISRQYIGALPATGTWVRLEVPAADVGMVGSTINGVAYALYSGRATWDATGVSGNGQSIQFDNGSLIARVGAGATSSLEQLMGSLVFNSGTNSIVAVDNGGLTMTLRALSLVRSAGATLSYTRTAGSYPAGDHLFTNGIADNTSVPWATVNGSPAVYTVAEGLVETNSAAKITQQNGDWAVGSTWEGGLAPAVSDDVIIRHNVTLTADQTCRSVAFDSGNPAIVGASTLTVSSGVITASGTVAPTVGANVLLGGEGVVTQASSGTMAITGVVSSQQATIPTAGQWAFDEGAGTTTADSSGNGNTGTLQGGPTWVAGTVGAWALQFNGTADYVSVPAFSRNGGPITVSYWVYVASADAGQQSFTFGVGSGGVGNRFSAHSPWGGLVCWDYGNISGNGRISCSMAGHYDKWTHVALVSAGAGGDYKAIYLDGTLAASAAVSDGPSSAITDLQVGHTPEVAVGNNHFKGRIDDFRIYNCVLSALEITALFNKADPQRGGGLTKSGSGTLVLAGNNTYTDVTNTLAGTLQIAADNNLGAAANGVTLSGGTLAAAGTFTTARTITLSGCGGTIDVANAQTLTLTAALGATSAPFAKSGAGQMTVQTASTRTGTTTINAGVLQVPTLASGSALGSGAVTVNSATLEVASPGTATNFMNALTLNNGATVRGTGGMPSGSGLSGTVTVAAGAAFSLQTVMAADVLRVNGNVSGGGGGSTVTVNGPGRTVIAAANTYVGNWTQNSGILEAANAASLGNAGNTVAVNGGVFGSSAASEAHGIVLNGGTLASIAGDRTYSGSVSVSAPSTVSLDDPLGPGTARGVTLTGVLSGSAGLSVTAPNATKAFTVTNSGNTYSGTIAISPNAVVQAQNAGSLGPSGAAAAIQLAGGTLQLQSNSPADFYASVNVTANSTIAVNNAVTLGNLTMGSQTLTVASTYVEYVQADSTTQGSWKGVYGSDGYNIINDTQSLPAYAAVTATGNNVVSWANPTADPRALQKAGATSDRIAACWYTNTNPWTIEVNLTDGLPHQVALYALDWDQLGARQMRIDVKDYASGAVLDSRTVGPYNTGLYEVWNVRGRVNFEMTVLAGGTATITGIFFDGAIGTPAVLTFSGVGTLTGNATLNTASAGVRLAGAAGDGGGAYSLTKAGANTLQLLANNTYSGATAVNAGTLLVDGSIAGSAATVNGTATLGGTGTTGTITVPAAQTGTISPGDPVTGPGILNTGPVSFGDSSSTFTVQLNGTTAGTQYDQLNVTGTVTLNNCTLNALLGYTPTVGDSFTIINNDGADAVLGTFNGLPEGARFGIGACAFTITYAGGDGNDVVLTRVAAGTFTWNGAGADNNWTTGANWVGGVAPSPGDDLVFGNAGALRKTNVNDFPASTLFNSITFNDVGYSISGNSIALGPGGITATAAAGANTLATPISLAADRIVTTDAGTLTISGAISGTGGLTKQGTGTFTLSGVNTYGGATTINAGSLQVQGGNAVPDLSAVTVTALTSTLTLLADEEIGSLAGNGNVNLNAFTLTTGGNNSTTFHNNGVISGTGRIVKTGNGIFRLASANTYSGGTTLNQGTLGFAVSGTGPIGTGTLVINGGAIAADSNPRTVGNAITVNANFAVTDVGPPGPLTLTGPVTLAVTPTINVTATNPTTISSVIGGAFGLTKNGPGVLTLTGAVANTFSGVTTVNDGRLILSKSAGVAAIGGDLVIGTPNASWPNSGVELAANEQIPDTAVITAQGTAGLDYSGFRTEGLTETVAGISCANGSGVIENASDTQTVNTDGTLIVTNGVAYSFNGYIRNGGLGTGKLNLTKNGVATLTLVGSNISYTGTTTVSAGTLALSDTTGFASAVTDNAMLELNSTIAPPGWALATAVGGAGAVTKTGTGTVVLAAANTYTGATTVNVGTLLVNGSIAGPASVVASATLGGTGIVQAITASGDVSPGSGGVGTLTGTSADLSGGGTLRIEIPSDASADRLSLTGNLTLGGASTLVVDLSGYTNAMANAQFTVASTTAARSGTFTTVSVVNNTSGKPVMVGYNAGDVNVGVGVIPTGATTPVVSSIVRAGPDPTSAAAVDFTVTFSEGVTGVGTTDFALTTTGGITGASIVGVAGGPSVYTVTVNTGTGNGTIRLDVTDDNTVVNSGGVSLGGLAFGDGNYSSGAVYTVDKTIPTVSSSVRANASPTNAGSVQFTVTFNENVAGVDATDFALTTTGGIAGASVSGVAGGPSVYTVTVNTGTGDGTIRLDVVDDDSIQNGALTPLGGAGAGNGNFTAGEAYTVDKTSPAVASSVRANGNPTNLASVDFTVTFSENVSGVDTADFTLTTTGVAGASIAGVVGGPQVYTVSVNTGTGDGTIRLDVVDDDSIVDGASNPLGGAGAGNGNFSAGETYNVIKTAPIVSSSVRAGASPTNLGSVSFTVTFSANVSGVDASDFALTTTGGIAGASISGVAGGPSVYTVTVNTGSGDGTIRLDVVDNDSIVDGASNPLGGAGAGNGSFTSGEVYTIDKTPPNVASSVRAGASPTNAGSVQFTVTFSKSVTGVDTGDFTLTTTGGIAGASVSGVAGGPTVYTVTANTGSGDGTIRLDVADNDSITDAATNPLGGPGAGNGNFNTGEVYAVDKTPPSVVSINWANGNPTNAGSVQYAVMFSESVSGVDTGDFTLTTTGGIAGASVSGVAGGPAVYTVSVNTGSGDGTIRLDVADNDSITDTAGNPLGGPGAGNGSFATGQAYTIDKTGPLVTNVTSSAADGAYGAGQTIAVTITFNEAVTVSGGPPQLTLATGGPGYGVNYGSGSGTNTLTFSYTVQAGHNSPDLDYVGAGALALSGGTICDAALNDANLTLPNPGAAGSLGANKNLLVEGRLPTIASIGPVDGPMQGGQTVVITGTNFVANYTTVDLGGAAATNVVVVDSTRLTAMTTGHAASTLPVPVTVTTFGNQPATLAGAYTYKDDFLLTMSVSPNPVASGMAVQFKAQTNYDNLTYYLGFDFDPVTQKNNGVVVSVNTAAPPSPLPPWLLGVTSRSFTASHTYTPQSDTWYYVRLQLMNKTKNPDGTNVDPDQLPVIGQWQMRVVTGNPSAQPDSVFNQIQNSVTAVLGTTGTGQSLVVTVCVVRPGKPAKPGDQDPPDLPGVLVFVITVGALTHEDYEVTTDIEGVKGLLATIAGETVIQKFTESGVYVLTSTITNATTHEYVGKIHMTVPISRTETGETPLMTTEPSSHEISGVKMKGKFQFKRTNPDMVQLHGTVELPAGLDISKEHELAIGIGNVIDSVMVDAKGRGMSKGVLGRIKSVRVKYPKLKGTTITTPGHTATVDVLLSTPDMDVKGFDTEGIRPDVKDLVSQANVQVMMVLGGVSYGAVAPVQLKLSSKRDNGTMLTKYIVY